MAGYSGTPLVKKLGYKPGFKVLVKAAPSDYWSWLEPLPDGVRRVNRLTHDLDLIHVFVTERHVLKNFLPRAMTRLRPAGMIWVSWPKKAAKVPTDMTEGVVRDIALPLGLVDVKVCAVDATWSGLKLVIRKANRKG